MADQSNGISWCDETWNPTRGCRRVSEGCRHCWAERMAARLSGPGKAYDGLVSTASHFSCRPRWTGRARFVPEMLERPLRWRKPRRIAVSLMGDLFHEDIAFEEIAAVFGVMAATPQHTYLILTKRPERMVEFHEWLAASNVGYGPADHCVIAAGVKMGRPEFLVPRVEWPLPNVWVGVSAENQQTLEERWRYLAQVPAAVRWISLEPLLAHVDLGQLHKVGKHLVGNCEHSAEPDWVVVGGESGPRARPCHVSWITAIAAQCLNAGIPMHIKQLGSCPVDELEPTGRFRTHEGRRQMEVTAKRYSISDSKGAVMDDWPPDLRVREWPEVISG